MKKNDNDFKIDISVLNEVKEANKLNCNERPLIVKKLGKTY